MARKQVVRRLPPLPKSPSFKKKDHKSEILFETLRHLGVAAQEERPRAFYSMREIATRFRVPISTVSGIYQRLERDGLLRRIRGSKTMLRGLKYDRKVSVRAFVGLPAFVSRFVTIQDYRMFFIRTRRELRLSGFATAMLFVDVGQKEDFVERVKKNEIDTIIWFSPRSLAKEVTLRLNDAGIRVIGISDGGVSSIPCRYEVRRAEAIKTILEDWRSAGLKSAIIVSDKSSGMSTDEQRLRESLEAVDLVYEFVSCRAKAIPAFLDSLARKKGTGIIVLSYPASLFSFRAPEKVTEFFKRCRVALIEGPVNMPFVKVPDVPVDLVLVDWQLVAERIVKDLINQEAFGNDKTFVFEAESRLRVPLNQYAQSI